MKQTGCKKCGGQQTPCGCCAGVEAVTPLPTANRPGLDKLSYRVGTHATFFATMQAGLTSEKLPQLAKLTTRAASDPALALLDAWATVADVLTFYQERIANEGYLRTATERRSILELARLVGYRPRPGVAASAHLALTLEDKHEVMIEPFQLRAQSVPGPGELPQVFENIETLDARAAWNRLRPRMTQPQRAGDLARQAATNDGAQLYLRGIATGLNVNDPLLIVAAGVPQLYRVLEVKPDPSAERTQVKIRLWRLAETKSAARERLEEIAAPRADAEAVNTALTRLRAAMEAQRSDSELADFIEREMLPDLSRAARRRSIGAEARAELRALRDELATTTSSLRPTAPAAAEDVAVASQTSGAVDIFGGTSIPGTNKKVGGVVNGLTTPPSVPPPNSPSLRRNAADAVAQRSDLGLQIFGAFFPQQRAALTSALANVNVTPPNQLEVYALRAKAAPFGHNAPLHAVVSDVTGRQGSKQVTFEEWTAEEVRAAEEDYKAGDAEFSSVIYLDASYDKILPDSWIIIDTSAVTTNQNKKIAAANPGLLLAKAATVQAGIARAVYGISGKSTRLELVAPVTRSRANWIKFNIPTEIVIGAAATAAAFPTDEFQIIRHTAVYAQSERLELAEAPIAEPICDQTETNQLTTNRDVAKQTATAGWIVLDGVYSELKSGRWVIIAGERSDIKDANGQPVRGVRAAELAMIAEVVHDFDATLPGDTVHTRIRLSEKLAYCYQREQVTIYANVVKATHGETRRETLGSGDGSQAFQRFTLRQPPLTYVSAPTPDGAESTLKIFVNDVRWREAEHICALGPTDRRFVTERSDDEVTTAVFGDGVRGARLPTGAENVRAEYRQGLGKAGNVNAEQLSQLAARPLGVKEVINPLRASGGADRESRDQARKNAPLAVLALDRLVAAQDYADFARTFAGVGKAYAARLSDGRRQLVHLTIAGADDGPIEPTSDLWRNLRQALRRFGDPALPFMLALRERVLLLISARVRILPDYQWEKVARQLRAKLLEAFSFEKRELGQDVMLSEVIAVMQSVAGVAFVDVDSFGGIAEKEKNEDGKEKNEDGNEKNKDGTVRTPKQLLDEGAKIADNLNSRDPNIRRRSQRVPVNLPKLDGGTLRAAQLAYLAPEVPDLLILNQVESNGS